MKWARPTGSSRSSRKLKLHRSTRSFVGAATLGVGEERARESGLFILSPIQEHLTKAPKDWGSYLGAFMAQ